MRSNFNTASCSSNYCLAAGTYFISNTVFVPLVVVSHDGGVSWESVVYSATTSAQPSDLAAGQLGNGVFNDGSVIPDFGAQVKKSTQSPYDHSEMLKSLLS